jgi:hypothetical protein
MRVFPPISSAQQWIWNRCRLLLCMSLFWHETGHADCIARRPLSGAKRKTFAGHDYRKRLRPISLSATDEIAKQITLNKLGHSENQVRSLGVGSDFRFWHFSDVTVALANVCC